VFLNLLALYLFVFQLVVVDDLSSLQLHTRKEQTKVSAGSLFANFRLSAKLY